MTRLALLVATIATATACVPSNEESAVEGLRKVSGDVTTDDGGHASFTVPVSGESKMLVTFEADAPYNAVAYTLTDPHGDVVLSAEDEWAAVPSRYRTSAVYPDRVVSLNWPILSDPGLEDGDYVVDVAVLDADNYYVRNAGVKVTALLEADDDFASGDLDVDLVYCGGTDQDETVTSAFDAAIDVWRTIYAQIGVGLNVTTTTYDVSTLPAPGKGAEDDYVAISKATTLRGVNVVVVPSIQDGADLYGIAGGIPGPLVPTGWSAVTVSVANNAGPDLQFDDPEIELLGETMAHEVGHFTGLFHPVESSYDAWDAVDDTPECSGEADCQQKLGSNLMFPYPLCDQSGSCIAQDQVTPGQGDVTQRYVGVE